MTEDNLNHRPEAAPNTPEPATPPADGNENLPDSLKKMGNDISRLMHPNAPPSEEFSARLKSRLLAERQQQRMRQQEFLSRVSAFLRAAFRPARLSAAVAVLVLVAIVSASLIRPSSRTELAEGGWNTAFSSLVISPAYAADNFTLEPAVADSLGAAPDSAYVLKSRMPLATALIKQNLKTEPAVEVKVVEVSQSEWRIEPIKPLAANTVLKVSLAASFKDGAGKQQERDFGWAFQVKDRFRVLTAFPRQASTGVPTNTGIEIKFSHENYVEAERHFRVLPDVKGKFERHGRTLAFVPDEPLQAGTVYAVTLSKGVALDGSGETLAEDYTFSFETQRPADATPSYWFGVVDQADFAPGQAITLEAWGDKLPNNQVSVNVYRFASADDYLAELQKRDRLPWWSNKWTDFVIDVSGLTKVASFNAPIETLGYSKVIRFPDGLAAGHYVAEVEIPGLKRQARIQVSALAAYLNVSKDRTLVWVNGLDSKAPVADADVKVVGANLAGRTDADGVAVFASPSALTTASHDNRNYERPYLRVGRGDSVTILPASGRSYSYDYASSPADDYWNYLYTDRPQYQLSDVIKFWGLLRERATKAPPTKPVTLALYKEGYVDYYFEPVRVLTEMLTPGADGTFIGEMRFANLRPDYYTLELSVGDDVIARKYVRLVAYTKPAYQLELTPDRTVAFAGESVGANIKASFFEGTPVPGLKINAEGADANQVTTGTDGQARVTVTHPYADPPNALECWSSCWPKYGYVRVTPSEGELADITAEANIAFYGSKVYLTDEVKYPRKGQAELRVLARKIDLPAIADGTYTGEEYWRGKEPAGGTRLQVKVTRVTWVAIETGTAYDFINKRTYKTYRYEERKEAVQDNTVQTAADGTYVQQFVTQPEGYYLINIQSFDVDNHVDYDTAYAYYNDGEQTYSYANDDAPFYHLVADNDQGEYSLNETVHLTFRDGRKRLPEESVKRFLYLRHHNGLQDYQVSDRAEQSFAFGDDQVPNVTVGGVWFNGLTYVESQTFYASYRSQDKELKVTVTPDKPRYQPGEQVTLQVATADRNGQPVPAEVNLNLVDEAFYAVVNDYAAPLQTIYQSIGSGEYFTTSSHEPPVNLRAGGAEKGCFLAGTMITMADGSRQPIERVRAGDRVLTFADPRRSEHVVGTVTETYRHVVDRILVVNGRLHVTPEHRVYANRSFRTAGELKVGDLMLASDGRAVRVESIKEETGSFQVYNFRVDPQHTFFADGFFVHNEKGGGPREFFVDTAVFQSVGTGTDGRATLNFKLPDNLTSWRVTAQGISRDLQVGLEVTKIPVSLPVFVDVTMADEYLVADKPTVKLRAFGTALSRDERVGFGLLAPTLGWGQEKKADGIAFTPAYLALPALSAGRHDLTYSVSASEGQDSVKLPLTAVVSRLAANKIVASGALAANQSFAVPDNQDFTVVLSDRGQSQLYWPLVGMAWSWGDRVDQSLARKQAAELLSRLFHETVPTRSFQASRYQLADGGVALLPYAETEPQLTARLAAAAAAEFDQVSMKQYFYGLLENRQSGLEEVTYALYGLSALGEPMLGRLGDWAKRTDLTPLQKVVVALSYNAAGDKESARRAAADLLKQYGYSEGGRTWLKVSDKPEDIAIATGEMAVLAAALNLPERDALWKRINEVPAEDDLQHLEKLSYVAYAAKDLRPSPAKFSYSFRGRQEDVTLTGGRIYRVSVAAAHAGDLKIASVDGDVGYTVDVVSPMSDAELAKDQNLQVRREYLVDGKPTNKFKETDLIEVRLYPTFTKDAPDEAYRLTDYLPSGLMPVARTANYWERCGVNYPYDQDSHTSSFRVYKSMTDAGCGNAYVSYSARVKTRGEYKAEPAVLQSFLHPDVINRSASGAITIE